jgi:hypothetical protein
MPLAVDPNAVTETKNVWVEQSYLKKYCIFFHEIQESPDLLFPTFHKRIKGIKNI